MTLHNEYCQMSILAAWAMAHAWRHLGALLARRRIVFPLHQARMKAHHHHHQRGGAGVALRPGGAAAASASAGPACKGDKEVIRALHVADLSAMQPFSMSARQPVQVKNQPFPCSDEYWNELTQLAQWRALQRQLVQHAWSGRC